MLVKLERSITCKCILNRRNDAGLAAAELALAVEKHVLESGSVDTVGTVGKSREFFCVFLILSDAKSFALNKASSISPE